MTQNHSQPGQIPSDFLIITNDDNPSNIDQLLSVDIIPTSQSSSSSSSLLAFNPTMITTTTLNVSQSNAIDNPSDGHRNRSQQRRQQVIRQRLVEQRQLQQQLRELQQEQRQQHRIRQHLLSDDQRQRQLEENEQLRQRRERNRQQQQQQSHHRSYQRYIDRYEADRQEREHEWYLAQRSPTYDEHADMVFTERELEEYNFNRMATQERKTITEQEHLNEVQGYPTKCALQLPSDHIDRYTEFLHEQECLNELEQTLQIINAEKEEDLQEYRRIQEL